MWPFGKKPSAPPTPSLGPIETLFANYVLDVIGELPADERQTCEALAPKLAATLKTRATEWKSVVAETLHLSATIEIAILDLWFRNSDLARQSGASLTPADFAVMFVVEYKKAGSAIDTWPGDSLEQAKARVAARRS